MRMCSAFRAAHHCPVGNMIDVLCIGPALQVRGGITRVVARVGGRFPAGIRFRVLPSFTKYAGRDHPDRGTKLLQLLVLTWALARIAVTALFARNTVHHVHLSERGSALRKGIICMLLRALRCRYILHTHAAERQLFHSAVPPFVRNACLWGMRGSAVVIALTNVWRNYYARELRIPCDR